MAVRGFFLGGGGKGALEHVFLKTTLAFFCDIIPPMFLFLSSVFPDEWTIGS